ncbi:MAG: hypothetical protein JJ863_35850 [Deltaproteobacteria bacterium]|nr:hypothetical protein [Deltaproteobacteria bacterium]
MDVLIDNEHLTVEAIRDRRVIVVRRKRTRLEASELVGAYREALRASDEFRGWGLVIDTREAPGRNDPEFESRIDSLRDSVDGLFPRVAMCLQTAAGELQARRMQSERRETRPSTSETFFTRDIAEAVSHAAGD